jgi:hypothetical protein
MRHATLAIAALLALVFSSCGAPPPVSPVPGTAASSPTAVPSAAGPLPPLMYVAFGDSWAGGYHCGGCRTFAGLYADGLEQRTGRRVVFTDLTAAAESGGRDWGTTTSLAVNLKAYPAARRETTRADVVLIALGRNDMAETLDALHSGICGGNDGLRCVRELRTLWTANFTTILVGIEELRGQRPTAIRLVDAGSPFLADPSMVEGLGADFAMTTGLLIMTSLRDAMCDVAAARHAVCVDVLPIINGPRFDEPASEDSAKTMQAVADALLAAGLPELGL